MEVWTKTEEEILAETTAASSIRGGGFARAPTTAGPAPTPSSSPTRLQSIDRLVRYAEWPRGDVAS